MGQSHGLENATHFLLRGSNFCKCEYYNRIEREKRRMVEMDEKTIFRKVKKSNGIYTCDELDITVEEWKKVLQDKSITNNYKLWLARFYQEPEHKATCKYMGDKYKCHPNVANASIKNFAEITQKILNRFEVQGTDGKPTYWVIPMKKGVEKKDHFEWTMRDELVQALEELDMTNPENFEENINFWSGGIYWGKEKKFEEFSTNNYWQIGWDKNSDTKSAIDSWKNIQKIQIGDLLSFHGYGGKNDLTIYQISKVIDKNEDEGKLLIEKINKKDDVLFHDKAPKMEKGGWFGTLFQVTGEEAINKIFGNYIQGDTQMTQENSLVKKYANLLKNTKNLILTGAPGTGKTYLAKTLAARLILDREINDFDKELSEEEKKQVESQIGFVQFHPSYDYTDFVEGLRPTDKDGNGNVGFERRDGVFKKFCERALKNLVDSKKSNEELKTQLSFKESFDLLCNKIQNEEIKTIELRNGVSMEISGLNDELTSIYLKTKDSTVKPYTFSLNRLIKLSEVFKSKEDLKSITNIDNAIRDVIGGCHSSGYWGILNKIYEINELSDNGIQETTKIPQKNFVFIIDEINRGEVAKIFGELFYSVDPGYRVTSDDLNAIKNGNRTITTIKTQYANLETEGNEFDKVLQKKEKDFGHFFIPENVYIIGTMNDIDRSVESMDFAFRRRFTWAEVKAKHTQYMLDAELDAVLAKEAKRRMENLNNAISEIGGLNEAYHIGASYFLKLKNYDGNQDERFESLWEYHIKGILQEYLRGNPKGKLEDLKAAYDREDLTK